VQRGNGGVASARRELAEGEIVAHALLTVEDAEVDEAIREEIGDVGLAAGRLAEDAGFNVLVRAQLWDNGEIDTGWRVSAPEGLGDDLEALVWVGPEGHLDYTLTRSTRHPGWQLTTWARDGGPWGHADIMGDVADAFDTGAMASGQSLSGLAQVILKDGRVLVRRGAKRIDFNPARWVKQDELKQSLLR